MLCLWLQFFIHLACKEFLVLLLQYKLKLIDILFEILGVEVLRILNWLTCFDQQRVLIYAVLELQLVGLDLLEHIRSQILCVELEANHDLANVLWLGHFQFFIGYAVLIVALLQRSA
jgi:hypothetical protein